ncbi:MAG TPA: hypothetical protein VLH39_00185 [Magnetospirillaceae bacterium]|nr:hypothetical protein [Magnetospirillaceae bacterium]
MTEALSQSALQERRNLLLRFRELLRRQRDKFRSYLEVLDHQRTDIESGDVDALVSHVELEQGIVGEIFAFQKVIDPMEDLYRAAYPSAAEDDIPALKVTLEELKTEVMLRNENNRRLLKQRMDLLRHEIMSVNNPYARKKSVYADAGEAGLVDLKG